MDLRAIADGIAAQFTGATTSAGETFSSAPTASLPNNIATGPVCLVYPPTGVLDLDIGRMRNDEYEFPVRILLDPTDVPSRSDALYRWFTATRDLVEENVDLGLSYVSWARVTASRIEIDGERYSSVDGTYAPFDVVEYTVRVHVRDIVTTLGI